MLRKLAYRMPGPVFTAIRAGYRTLRSVCRLPFWAWRLIAFQLAGRSRPLPVVGVHTVFLPGENVLFLEEWVIYHHLKGITHFFLYDNTGSTRASDVDVDNPYLRYGQVSKYGVPYDETVLLSQTEVDEVISRIQSELPGVHIIRWAPRDESGQIVYEHEKAQNDALARFGEMADWIVFMDMDEFLVSSETIPQVCRWLESRGLDGGLMAERVMASRYDHLDRFVVENNMAYRDPYTVISKYLCHTGRVRHARAHSFHSRGRQIVFDAQRLHFLHYKMPSLHSDMSGRFVPVDTGIDSALLEAYRAHMSTRGGPEWRLTVVNPDWRGLMEQVDPSWHLVRASSQLADERRAFPHGQEIAAVARTMLPAGTDRDGC